MKTKISIALILSMLFSATAFASFTDVSTAHLNFDAIDYAQTEGIVEGYEDGTFRPDVAINRAEFTKVIIATAFDQTTLDGCNTSSFTDVPDGAWYLPYICVAELEGIVDGYADRSYKPANLINFAETSKIITNTIVEPTNLGGVVWFQPFVQKLESLNAIPITIENFEHNITRGEMVEMIWRLKESIKNLDSQTYEELEGAAPTNGTFEFDMTNYEFSETELRVNQGDTVTITLNNIVGTHNFAIDAYDLESLTITSGQTTEVTFTATQRGTFEYYCSVGNHRALGMVGKLIVE